MEALNQSGLTTIRGIGGKEFVRNAALDDLAAAKAWVKREDIGKCFFGALQIRRQIKKQIHSLPNAPLEGCSELQWSGD